MRRSVNIQQLGRSTRYENLADIVNDLGTAVDRLLLAESNPALILPALVEVDRRRLCRQSVFAIWTVAVAEDRVETNSSWSLIAFIDFLRSSRGAKLSPRFSVQAGSGLAVSMPVSWDELKEVTRSDEWTVAKAVARQRTLKADPWDGYWRTRQGITAAMRRAVERTR